MNTKIIGFSLLFSFFAINCLAQYPFSSFKNEKIYCFDKEEIVKHDITKIQIASQTYKKGEYRHHWEMGIIQFGEHETSENRRKYSFATDTVIPLPTLLKVTDFASGEYYQFERDKIVSAGTRAFGKLCRNGYHHREGYTIVENRCRFDEKGMISIIHYQLPRAPKYMLINPNRTLDLENNSIDQALQGLVFQDTIFYNYNKDGSLNTIYNSQTATTTNYFDKIDTAVPDDYNSTYKHYQVYVDSYMTLEEFTQQSLGFSPKYLLFEIYENAAFCFLFDEETQKYYQQPTVNLELGIGSY